ncbi:potassium/proton antiporter [Kineosporia mesophila]|uniref:Potassium/proton antiporter n=1 Tax=Kineosporia mesophila TaxID=566012 RepID=A0ABP7AEE0_9ACTN|nr:potassium/proton antiporter [Kineosporia mesophila]MCD5352835.1 potassium/proton antiporter [Kineosporia mesophila]
MTIEQLNLALLAGPAVLLAAVAAVRLSTGTGLPSLLLYLALGLVIGEGGFGLQFEDAELTSVLGYAALVLILAEGGLTTRWATIKPSVAPAALLATVGTCVSVAIAGTGAHFVLSLDWPLALLLGAAISSTDAAAVFSVLRRVPLPPRLVGMLEAESGFNDAPVVIIVIALTEVAHGSAEHGIGYLLYEAGFELIVGTAMGLGIGWLGAFALRRVALPSSGLYPIAVFAFAIGSYGAAASIHASGFIAVYLCSLVIGNSQLPHGVAVRGFAEGLGWIAQIGLFVMLGLLASPERLPAQAGPAFLIGLVLLLVARPLSVLASVSWFGVSLREQAFLSWAGLRGAVPVVLATVPVAQGVENSRQLFDIVFCLVLIFTVVQAPTLPWVAKRLGLSDDTPTIGLEVESVPLGAQGADVLECKVSKESRLHGVEIFELRLPPGANVTLILRDGEAIVPDNRTALRRGDDLIVVTPAAVRAATENRLKAVSAGGKLSGWHDRDQPDGARRTVPAAPPSRALVTKTRPGLPPEATFSGVPWGGRALVRRLRPGARRPDQDARRRRSS